jgi:hypothetical protein
VKLYGKLVYTGSDGGVVREHKFNTEQEAKAYVQGFEDAKEQLDLADEPQLDEYVACVDSTSTPDHPEALS